MTLEYLDDLPRPRPGAHKSTPPFAALRAFESVGRVGGLRRAAQDLGLDHAVVSRHVRALESWLGVSLIDRLQSGGRLTPDGERYHRRISAALGEIAAATTDLMRPGEQGPLKIWCPQGFASHWLAPRLGQFRTDNPGLEIEVQPTEAKPNFAAREADADIRYVPGEATPAGLFTRVRWIELVRPEVMAVASPALLAAHPPVREPADLLALPLLHKKTDEQWRNWLGEQGLKGVGQVPGLRLWYNSMTVEAASRGQGVALANACVVRDQLRDGRLVKVDVGRPVTSGAYFFTTRADRWSHPPLVRLRRWLLQELAE
ncbi:LysR substrate-binding domain-containing protein [Phenylobacterium sp.]|jgi:DNA-binding transcriptional LysR family regulator|uniref:LysR substrate-binding domain-containing protein n=1 Tax=Phenylobacterium sp. TaxID=1871053 RepID=UPI002E2FA53E|nr:LysR substrate-binding domain-containing protein [Phenylobacterium sp.]HEX2562206.1 LysR substrate-binding domain-containing protein [Phenylobacterium sp.]